MPHSPATPRSLARAAIAFESGRVVRPLTVADPDQPDAVRAWEALLDAGLIGPARRRRRHARWRPVRVNFGGRRGGRGSQFRVVGRGWQPRRPAPAGLLGSSSC